MNVQPMVQKRLVGIAGGASALLCLLAPLSAQSPALEPQETFKSAIDVVSIQATVRDTRGRMVRGLTAADFEVLDNGQRRPIIELRSDQESPLSVAFLVDMSGSMKLPAKIDLVRQAFESVLVQLTGGRDEAAVYTFDSRLHERIGFTADLKKLKGALDDFQPFGSTSLYDATAETARQVTARTSSHRAIVILTDGIDTSSSLTAAEVSGLASAIDVPVYIVATVTSLDQRRMVDAEQRALPTEAADLRDLAEWTGGRVVFATTFTESVLLATSIVQELRQQYVLAIEAAPQREWRRLEVRVRRPSATVKSRSGYFGS
jgi:VWFA-related protein